MNKNLKNKINGTAATMLNAAMAPVTQEEQAEAADQSEQQCKKAPGRNKATEQEPDKRRNARLNLLTTAQTREQVKKIAFIENKSVNDIINELLDSYIAAHATEVSEYDKMARKYKIKL